MFAFGQPHSSGAVDHLRVDGFTLHIDVGELYNETRQAIEKNELVERQHCSNISIMRMGGCKR